MTEIVSCPSCGKKLQVPEDFFGKNVQCPECKQTFRAEPASAAGAVSASPAPPAAPAPSVPAWEKPPARTSRDEDEADRPRRRRRRDDDEDDDDDRPRRRRLLPHRGGMILAFGILSFFVMPIIFGPMAWAMGTADLRDMRAGRMDPSGEGMTQTGRILGIVSVCIMIASLVLFCLFFAFIMAMGIIGGAAHHR